MGDDEGVWVMSGDRWGVMMRVVWVMMGGDEEGCVGDDEGDDEGWVGDDVGSVGDYEGGDGGG